MYLSEIDLTQDPLGYTPNGKPVFLKDIWPSTEEINKAVKEGLSSEIYRKEYEKIEEGDPYWKALEAPTSVLFKWDPNSTYIRNPPFFDEQYFSLKGKSFADIKGAQILGLFHDKVSTDHISPAGAIASQSPAGRYRGTR